jgi:hypothetical protein
MSLGMAPVFTIGNEIIITAAPPERAGAASAISETASEFSGALGIAVFGSIGIALYRHLLAPALPAGLSPDAAAVALATLGGAGAVGQTLGGATGAALIGAARSAFTDALQLVAVLGAVIIVSASVLAARMLRRGGGTSASTAHERAGNSLRRSRQQTSRLVSSSPYSGPSAPERASNGRILGKVAAGCARLCAALDRVPDAAHRTTGMLDRDRAARQDRSRAGVRARRPASPRRADAGAPLPGRIAFEDLHGRGHPEAAREGRLRLDDPIGTHVAGLHPKIAEATLAQLLSHSAGLVRDGTDAGQWADRRAFLDEAALRADLADGPTIEANTRFKYSNHGFGPARPRDRGDHR